MQIVLYSLGEAIVSMKSQPALAILSFVPALLMIAWVGQAVGAEGQPSMTPSNEDMQTQRQVGESAPPCAHVKIGKSFSTFFAMGLVNWEVIKVSPEFQRATVRDKSGGLDSKTVPCSSVP